jgi:polysaccharide biosynthesis transport protein
MLVQAQNDQGQLLAAPNQLLESQPALRRLKDGLIDAQIQTAQLKGRMNDAHPLVQAARESEKEIGRHLHDELAIAIRGAKADLRLTADRIDLLEERLAEVTGRLERLAELRAPYANQLAVTANRIAALQRAEQQLSQARASQANASITNLISRIDAPDTGTRPLGPGGMIIVLAGMVGGLCVGLGVLVMTVPVPHVPHTVVDAAGSGARAPAAAEPSTIAKPGTPARRPAGLPVATPGRAAAGTLTAALEKLNGNGRGSAKV